MHKKKPAELELGIDAATEIANQSVRKDEVAKVVQALSERIASQDNDRLEDLRDVVERKHVLEAAERLFSADQSWLSALDRGNGVFLSYSTKDEDFARELEADLRAEGVSCFLAPLS